jgi:hypothetical protein
MRHGSLNAHVVVKCEHQKCIESAVFFNNICNPSSKFSEAGLKAYDGLTEINHRDKPIKLITKYPIEMPETYGYITNVLHCSKGQFT